MKLNAEQLNAIAKETNDIHNLFHNAASQTAPQFKLFMDIFDKPKLLATWESYIGNNRQVKYQKTYHIGPKGKLSNDSYTMTDNGKRYDLINKRWL
jgi:hypothetical protein